jgi:hypothetical protein
VGTNESIDGDESMNQTSRGLVAGAVLLMTPMLGVPLAAAQETPTRPTTPAPEATPAASDATPAISPAEQAEIDKATGADAASDAAKAAAPGPSTGGGAVQSMNPDLSVILDVAGAAFSQDQPLQGGAHDPSSSGFTLQQLEISFSHNVDPYFRFDSHIVFSDRETPDVEEAYATTTALPYSLQLRAGKFLTRFGRSNPTHPHTWDFVDQPFASTRVFGGEGNRGLGAEISWLSPLPWYVELVGSATMAEDIDTNRSFYGATDAGVHGLRDLEYVVAAKQFFDLNDDWSLLWGLSTASGPNDSGIPLGKDESTQIYGTDVYLKYRPITYGSNTIVSLTAEYFQVRRHVPGDTLVDHNAYAYLFYRFAQRWATAVRWEIGTPADGSHGVADTLDPDWTSNRQRVSANLTFWPSEFSRFRLQGSMDAPGWQKDPTWAAMLAAEFVVGAHGAHQF